MVKVVASYAGPLENINNYYNVITHNKHENTTNIII